EEGTAWLQQQGRGCGEHGELQDGACKETVDRPTAFTSTSQGPTGTPWSSVFPPPNLLQR
ncbi:MAG: hypothetical protein ACO3JL_14955, partial [Myxococcota bacterium]